MSGLRAASPGQLAAAAALLASAAYGLAGLYPGGVPDTFGHLAQGRQIVELGRVPRLDRWSLLVPPRPFYNYEWLSDWLFYSLYADFGYDALIALKCVALSGLSLGLCLIARQLQGPAAQVWTAGLLIAAVPAVRHRLSDRPHVFGLLLLALTWLLLNALARERRRERAYLWLAALALVHCAWVNLHGSHLIGLVLTLCFLSFCRTLRVRFAWVLAAQLAVSCISPYGPRIWSDAIAHVSDDRFRRLVSEWQPWSNELHPLYLLAPVLQGVLLTLAGPKLARSSELARASLALAFVLACAGFRSTRFASDFLLFSAPVLGAGLGAWFPDRPGSAALASTAVLPLALWGSLELFPGRSFGGGWQAHNLPVASGAFLDRRAKSARLFGPMEDAWFLLFAAPRLRVFVDGRVPFYGVEHVLLAQLALREPPLFDELARRERFDAVILRHVWTEQRTLLRHMLASAAWQIAVIEHSHVLFVRRSLPGVGAPLPELGALQPFYRTDWIFGASDTQAAAIARALSALPSHPNSLAYRRWVRTSLALRARLRSGSEDGLRWPASGGESAVYERALAELDQLDRTLGEMVSVSLLRAQLAALLGHCAQAEQALRSAALRGARGRVYVMTLAELALRRGDLERVRALVAREGSAGSDPWLRALASALANPPRCRD